MVAGGAASGGTEAEHALQGADPEVAGVLRSYGRAVKMSDAGMQRVRVGSQDCALPVSRLGVEVRDREAYCRSFQAFAERTDRVRVEGNTVRFARGGRYFVIENRVG